MKENYWLIALYMLHFQLIVMQLFGVLHHENKGQK